MTDLTYANIDLEILKENYRALKGAAGESDLICVVKADAYGHGDIPCVRALSEAGCTSFATASLSEAMRVRKTSPDASVLIFGMTPPEHAPLLAEKHLTQTVYSAPYAKALSDAACGRIDVHIKLDTGMNRLGFSATDAGTAQAAKVCSLPRLSVSGIYSHLACADDPTSPMTERQLQLFRQAAKTVAEHCGEPLTLHIGNSAALKRFPDCLGIRAGSLRTALRAGILLYGLAPSDEVPAKGFTRPVMELYSTVTHVHTVKAGETVGYGATFKASRDTAVATVAIGYADGFLRAYGRGGAVELTEQCATAPIIGRICMDQLMLDVTDISPAVKPGDTARLFGRGGITADDVAKRADTIGYEVVCAVSGRVPRRYI